MYRLRSSRSMQMGHKPTVKVAYQILNRPAQSILELARECDGKMDWNAVSAVATSIAAIAAAYAAFQSKRQVQAAREASEISADSAQIQVFENIFRDIQQQEHQFYSSRHSTPKEKAQRDRMFFNTVNYLAFLLEAKILRKVDFMNYYRDAFLYWWNLFEKEVPAVDRDDPSKYEEFRRIVSGMKNPSPRFDMVS